MEKYIVLQGFYDCYAVSNYGNVKNIRNGYVLKPSIRPDGYRSVLLSKNGKKMSIKVHRLVAMYHVDVVDNKMHVNHKNGIKHDNQSENLEWCTPTENMRHAHDNDLMNHKYKNKTILVYSHDNGELLFSFESVKQASKFLNLNESPIYSVLKERRNHHHGYVFKYSDRIENSSPR